MNDQKHIKVKIVGRVQGVWFRASTKEQADKIGVKGYVQNEPDGSVSGEFEGSEESVNQLLEWCKQGPPMAEVERVEFTEDNWVGYTKFSIKK